MSTKRIEWGAAKLARLKEFAQIMTCPELANEFRCSAPTIRRVCGEHTIDYVKTSNKPRRYLSASKSIALFKNVFIKQPINQLLTQNWI